MRQSIILAALIAVACQREAEPYDPEGNGPEATGAVAASPDTPTSSAPSASLAAIETLAGEWRVAGIDGEPLDEPYGLALSADETEIWWPPRCANAAVSYSIEGSRIETGEAKPPAPVEPGTIGPPVCAIDRPPMLADVLRALREAQRVGRSASNAIVLEGGGHRLTLFSQ